MEIQPKASAARLNFFAFQTPLFRKFFSIPVRPLSGEIHPVMNRLKHIFTTAACTALFMVGGVSAQDARPSPGSWTIAVLPDTQYYVRSVQDAPLFTDMTRWLVENRTRYNIRMVLHVGDIVDNNTKEQWERAKASLSVLDGHLPYVLAVGNHDLEKNSSSRDTLFNDYFRISDNPLNGKTFGGSFEPGKLENAWYRFSAGNRQYLVFSLEFGPRKAVVEWAQGVAKQHADKSFILVTHDFIDQESTLFSDDGLPRHTTAKTKNSPHQYGIGKGGDVHSGKELWDAFVSRHSNFEIVVNGHFKAFKRSAQDPKKLEALRDLAVSYRSDPYPDGRVVHQMLFNAQWAPRGGNGWLRLLEFLPDGKTVNVWTVSPHLSASAKDDSAGWPASPELRFSFTLPPPAGR